MPIEIDSEPVILAGSTKGLMETQVLASQRENRKNWALKTIFAIHITLLLTVET